MTISKSPTDGAATSGSGDAGGRIGSSGTGGTTFVENSSYTPGGSGDLVRFGAGAGAALIIGGCRRGDSDSADGLRRRRLRSRRRRGVVHLREIAVPDRQQSHVSERRWIACPRELLDHAIEPHQCGAVLLGIEACLGLVEPAANEVDPNRLELRARARRHERRIGAISWMAQEERIDRDAGLVGPFEREETQDAVFRRLDVGIGAVRERRLVEGGKRLLVGG